MSLKIHKLFITTGCSACNECKEWLKSNPIPSLEVIEIDTNDPSSLAVTDFYDVFEFPTLVMESGKKFSGASIAGLSEELFILAEEGRDVRRT